MRADLAVLKSNENFSGSLTTTVSGATISYGDFASEQSNTPMHLYSDFPPYILNIKDIANSSITGIAISGNTLTACDISRFRSLNNLNIADNLLPRTEISQILVDLNTNGQENGTLTTSGNISGNITDEAVVAYYGLEINKGWVLDEKESYGIWSPSDASPVGWYDASDASTITLNGTKVTQWDDKSGNDYHLDQVDGGKEPEWGNGAQINGLNVMHYSGTLDQMSIDIADIDLTEFCMLGVGESKAVGDSPSFGFIRSTDSTDQLQFRFQCNDTNGRTSYGFTIDGVNPSLLTEYITEMADDIPFLASAWYFGTEAGTRINGGVEVDTTVMAGGSTFTINRIQVGRQSNTPRNYHAEMLILPVGDVATIEKAEGYLAHKWGLTGKLLSSHPYKNIPPRI